ncbi:MAG TPA: 3-phenylpropionate/cinnamic acid dioxygenase subunit beta [Candidatus Binataceae bacterium]|nr:3-phenylpropionate/cinnamic acid dioxygenase subunit beta [Candidatus Binataceae bacterium]
MAKPVGLELCHEIEQFYFREARLFSDKRYREWLGTMVDREVHYWLPIFEEHYRANRKPPPEFPPAVYDDDYADLEQRIERLETNLVWMEDPPSRIRHLITNVEAYHTDRPDEIETFSNFLVSRNRREREQTMLIGGREDRLRNTADGWRLLRRKIVIPQRVVMDTNLYYLI